MIVETNFSSFNWLFGYFFTGHLYDLLWEIKFWAVILPQLVKCYILSLKTEVGIVFAN